MNDKGTSVASDPNTSGPVVQTTAYAPTNLAVTDVSSTSHSVSWTTITTSPNDGYSTVTTYKIYSKNASSSDAYALA